MFKRAFYYITHWESWHWFAKYILIGPVWLWYCFRARSFWFFSSSNPGITFGGYLGETKEEVYQLLPPGTYPGSVFISPLFSLTEVVRRMDEKGLAFPVAAKAASGIMGFMFRRIDSIEQLRQYHSYMPFNYIVQELVTYPIEVSVFYYRYPHHLRGNITGFVKKELPEVIGDGIHSLWELIQAHPGVQFKLEEMRSKHAKRLYDVLEEGERYPLSHAINLSRGGRLISLADQKDDQLLHLFDSLSHHSGQLLFGRYDIRCQSIESLKNRKDYKILEFNGCGGEPHHVYGNGNSLWKACRILLHHWAILYKISRYNHLNGFPRWPHKKGVAFLKKSVQHVVRLKKLDKEFSFHAEITSHSLYKSSLQPVENYV
ncbi:MAG TPA: hypothetical protein VMZ69_03130 [Saprospiraceae bacterium]|nr:hypothetical protein [Saprospiraceae bacterium]